MTSAEPGPAATIGIDIGGSCVRAAVIDGAGAILDARRAVTPRTVADTEDLLVTLILELAALHRVSATGLAVAGFISTDRRRVMFSPHLAWREAEVPDRISARVGMPVVMDHDVNAAAWAEYHRGAAVGSPVALLIALGTGIGAGLVVDGQLYRGAFGVAPELGHLLVVPGGRPCSCGKRGCWERYCSGTALADTARELIIEHGSDALRDLAGGDIAGITGAMVGEAAALGDPTSLIALRELGRWLGSGLALVSDVLDPEVVVIGGGVSGAAEFFLPGAVDIFEREMTGSGHRPRARVELAAFGDQAGILGAAMMAAERVHAGLAV